MDGRAEGPRFNGVVVALFVGLTIAVGAAGVSWHFLGRARSPAATALASGEEPAASPRSGSPPPPTLQGRRAPAATKTANDHPEPLIGELTPEEVNRLPPEQSARLRANQVLSELERSGPPSAKLTSDALAALEKMKKLPALAGAELGDFRCFGDGCTFTATSKDPGAAEAAGQAIVRSEQFQRWSGPKFRSGQLPSPSGQIQTVVILFQSPGDRTPTTPTQESP